MASLACMYITCKCMFSLTNRGSLSYCGQFWPNFWLGKTLIHKYRWKIKTWPFKYRDTTFAVMKLSQNLGVAFVIGLLFLRVPWNAPYTSDSVQIVTSALFVMVTSYSVFFINLNMNLLCNFHHVICCIWYAYDLC